MSSEVAPISIAEVEQAEAFDGRAFLDERGLGELADEEYTAHGRSLTLAQAIKECEGLARVIVGLDDNLPEMEGRLDIIKNTIRSAGANAAEQVDPRTKKKLN